jgi:signal transduction histidine kinase
MSLNAEALNSNINYQQNLKLQGEINSMNLKIEGLKKELSEKLEGSEKISRIVLEKDEQIKEINNKIKDSELKIEEEKQNFADAVKKTFSLQSKLSELRENLIESHQENKKLAEAIEEKNKDLEKINALYKETSLKFRQEHEINVRSINKISALQSEIEKMKEVIVREDEYSRELAKKLKDKEEDVEMLKKELDKIDVLQIEVEELKKRNRKITSIVQQEQFEFIQKISKSLEKLSVELKSVSLRVPVQQKQNLMVSDKNLSGVLNLLRTYQEYLDESIIETHPESIRNAIEQMLGQWEKAFKMKRLSIKSHIQANTPYCKVNLEKLKTAFNQIMKNSHEAMSAGGILTLTLSADTERKFVYVKFEDNGPGFVPEAIENMFIPFFTTKKEHIGIGLCTARKITEKLNGELSISNKKDKGVVVEFKFPASYEKDMP